MPTGSSLMSMEPLSEWFCKGADVTSPAEFEAALSQLEIRPPNIRDVNDNIREEGWNNFSLEGLKFPTVTIDVVKRGELVGMDNEWHGCLLMHCCHRRHLILYHFVHPKQLERLTAEDWDSLGRAGFAIYLFNPDSLPMRRLEPGESYKTAAQLSELTDGPLDPKEDEGKAQVALFATSSKDPLGEAASLTRIQRGS